jgi:uncharacterized short protein YbdD (DUF466 family)
MSRISTSGRTGFSVPSYAGWLRRVARIAWRSLREWCGDSAYERYVSFAAKRSSERRTLTAEEFYLEQLNRRYARPNRCC